MAKRQVFYSFHFDKDVFRVQQVRNIGALDGNASVSPNEWETVRRGGDRSIEKWIDENMSYRSCVVVLIGEETSQRPWVDFEIRKAWNEKKGLLGIYVHNLKCPKTGLGRRGSNPFASISLKNGTNLSTVVKTYDPSPSNAYADIAARIEGWVEAAISARQ